MRAWMGLSRHSSVVSRTPAPLVSIEPPSSTTRCSRPSWSWMVGVKAGRVQVLCGQHRKLVVKLPIVVLGPGVELPVCYRPRLHR